MRDKSGDMPLRSTCEPEERTSGGSATDMPAFRDLSTHELWPFLRELARGFVHHTGDYEAVSDFIELARRAAVYARMSARR